MSTRWQSPLTEARPPARPRSLDWLRVLIWVGAPACFWGVVALILYRIGVI